jgi:hypothetical protein
MRPLALPALLLLAACPQTRAPSPAASAPAATPPPTTPAGWTAAQQACVDTFLAGHGLDAFGSPQGTMYPGGTPLFDETTGRSVTRQDYLAQHHPDVLRSCGL